VNLVNYATWAGLLLGEYPASFMELAAQLSRKYSLIRGYSHISVASFSSAHIFWGLVLSETLTDSLSQSILIFRNRLGILRVSNKLRA